MDGEDVVCQIKNSATLAKQLYTLHVSQIHIDLPTLTDKDKEVSNNFCVGCLIFENQEHAVLTNFPHVNAGKRMSFFESK